MTILAIEFSSLQRSVAIVRGGAGPGASAISEAVETGADGTGAFGLIQSALREAGLERGEVETLAVGLGPGSYTGIRVALAIAQGWQLAFRPRRNKTGGDQQCRVPGGAGTGGKHPGPSACGSGCAAERILSGNL